MTACRSRYSRSGFEDEQTAAPQGSGCLSGFLLPPLVVLGVGCLLFLVVEGLGNSTARPAVGALSPVFTAEVQYWSPQIVTWAEMSGLDPNLAATVMQIESCGDPLARSVAGAMGLFQVMPFHFISFDNPYDPTTNATRGLAYLRKALEMSGGQYRLAFAGYNGGIGVIGRSESQWAAETRRYVYWANGIYTDVLNGLPESPRLQEWLAAGGASLCRQARQHLGGIP